jgi:peptidoglycan/LPS O-acetylase OafA/YrhL
MKALSSMRDVRSGPDFLWASAIVAFVVLEFIVVYAEFTKHSSKPWLFHFLYLPVMLSIPLSTGWPLWRGLRKRLLATNDIVMMNRISFALATMTLVSYLTLLIGIGDFL